MRSVVPKLQRNHIGLDGLIWAVGVVEDRADPLLLGRCRTRYFGWHTEDKEKMPTKELPWSYPLLDLDSGRSSVGPKEGDWVIGFFRDGIVAQEPVMIGIVPGIPEKEADPSIGFNDPRPDSLLVGHQVPRDPVSWPKQHDDGTGSDMDELGKVSRFPQNEPQDGHLRYVDNKEATTNRYERNEFIGDTIVKIKKDNVKIGQTDIPKPNDITHPDSGVGSDETSKGLIWTEPETPYSTKYPYNHAYWSESGHLIEVDDTPGGERLHWYHRSGTFREIHPLGTVVEKNVDEEHHITLKSRWTHIEARDIQVVDWNKQCLVNKDEKDGFNYDVTIGKGGDFNLTVKRGQYNKWIMSGDRNTRIKKNDNYLIEENELGEIIKDKRIVIGKNYEVEVFGYTKIITHHDCSIIALENLNLVASKDVNISAGGNVNLTSDKDLVYKVSGNVSGEVEGNKKEIVRGNYERIVYGDTTEMSAGQHIRSASSITDMSTSGNTHNILSHFLNVEADSILLNGVPPADGTKGDTVPVPSVDPGDLKSLSDIVIKRVTDEVTQIIADLVQEQIAKFEQEEDITSTDYNSAAAASASAAGGAGGPKGPTAYVDAPEDFLWKPVCGQGTACVLFPVDWSTQSAGTCVMTNSDGSHVENGRFYWSSGRDKYIFRHQGAWYAQNCKLPIQINCNGHTVLIYEPQKRGEGRPGALPPSQQVSTEGQTTPTVQTTT